MLKRINNIVQNLKDLDKKSLESIRYLLMFCIVVDLFGIYWYFELKKLGIALMIVIIVALAIILILERGKEQKMPEKDKKPEDKDKKEEKKEKKDDEDEESDFGLPNAEEYNKRLEEAIGV